MKYLLSLLCMLVYVLANTQISEKSNFNIGETFTITSKILEEDRSLNIYLPLSYQDSLHKEYPVIYLLDGSADEDFIHIAGLVQFGSFSWIRMIPETIVVGIANVDRKRDFTSPSSNDLDNKELPSSGGSEKFINFIADELQDVISNHYRVNDSKTLIGQSLGGLLATEILFTKPHLFDQYIIVSPSLWWNDEKLLDFTLENSLHDKSVYIAVGKEGPTMERVAKSLHEKLAVLDQDQLRLFFSYFEKLDHGDTLHLAVYDAFKKIFAENSKAE